MSQFNLTFSGEILPGRNPEKVRARFAELLAIDDEAQLARCFSGETVILREGLEMKEAADFYARLKKLGVEASLHKLAPQPAPAGERPPLQQRAEARAAEEARWRKERHRQEMQRQELLAQQQAQQEDRARARAEQTASRRKERAERERQRAADAASELARHRDRLQQQSQEIARRKEEAEAAAARHREALAQSQAQHREAAAQRKAERDAARRSAIRDQAASRNAELETLRSQQAEAEARHRAEREAQRQRQDALRAERQSRWQQARQQAQDAADKVLGETAEKRRKKREAALKRRREAEAERARLREERRQQQAEQHQQEEQRERRHEAEATLLEEGTLHRGAEALVDTGPRRLKGARVRTALELPKRAKSGTGEVRKRQPGAPNLYQAFPFRNTPEVRDRAALASRALRRGLVWATLAVALALLLAGRYIQREDLVPVTGASVAVAAPGGALLLLAADTLLLHDRSGVGKQSLPLAELGLATAGPPMVFDRDGRLLLQGVREGADTPRLLRCDLNHGDCQPAAQQALPFAVTAIASHLLTGEVFAAGGTPGQLAKLATDGAVAATAPRPMGDAAQLVLESGLLFTNSTEGPAISVLRYEERQFGRQIDEILLLPPVAGEREFTRARDFLAAGGNWWVWLDNPDTGDNGLFLFDSQWNFQREIEVAPPDQQASLVGWGNRVLLHTPGAASLPRFSDDGQPAVPLASDLLTERIERDRRWQLLASLGWTVVFSLCLVVVTAALSYAGHQYLRQLVYRNRSTHGAEALDTMANDISWVNPVPDTEARLRQQLKLWGAVALVVLAAAALLGAGPATLLACALALAGPLPAMVLYFRGDRGHAGTAGQTLALVDHRHMYHLASGARIQYRGPFLLIDDVVVFTGSPLLPALDAAQVQELLLPVAQTGARVDRRTVLVKLIEARHPLAIGAGSLALALFAAVLVLVAGQFW